ncbi:hypothetical protein RHGRI_017139 [Rhododendron griersonianum]|uniref:RHOMBOID-like protein n=1 Tax=Rhododendron griersonianum TaxID=479676 RepID=A0AAV6JWT7_9ERIC|nr:hypothetical protein RHGRI_017139 [Rhododendron griersonianum]
MAQTIAKDHTHIEINLKTPPPPPQPRLSIDSSAADEFVKEQSQRVPFFKTLYSQQRRNKREDAWVISLFVIFHLVAFIVSIIVNDCWRNSHHDCALKPLGMFSFQPLSENPLLGPSASANLKVKSGGKKSIKVNFNTYSSKLSLVQFSVTFKVRIGIIYILSGFSGSLVAVLFLEDRPSVTSSGALFGLLGAMLSGLLRNWNFYSNKFAAIVAILSILVINLMLGLLPYVNNFANIGGFISGFLLGLVLLFSPRLGQMPHSKGGLFDNEVTFSVKLRQKLDRPKLRSVSLVIFSLLLAGVIVAVIHGINANKYCGWCRYVDCVPSKWWSCNDKQMYCERAESEGRLTLTCNGSDKFRVFPFTGIKKARIEDLCNLICS